MEEVDINDVTQVPVDPDEPVFASDAAEPPREQHQGDEPVGQRPASGTGVSKTTYLADKAKAVLGAVAFKAQATAQGLRERMGTAESSDTEDMVIKLARLQAVDTQYTTLMTLLKRYKALMEGLADTQQALGNTLHEAGVLDVSSLSAPLQLSGDMHRDLSKQDRTLMESVAEWDESVSVFRNKAIADAVAQGKLYTDLRRVYDAKVHSLQALEARKEAGKTVTAAKLAKAQTALDEAASARERAQTSLDAKLVMLYEKRAQDLHVQLKRYAESFRDYYQASSEVVAKRWDELMDHRRQCTQGFKELMGSDDDADAADE